MIRHALSLALACILVTTTVAKERPNFSGTWLDDVVASRWEGRGNASGGLNLSPRPTRLTISQDDKLLTVDENWNELPLTNRVLYSFDGRPVSNLVLSANLWPRRPQLEMPTAPAVFTSKWNDNQIVSLIEISEPGAAVPRRYEQTMSLNLDGALLVRTQATGTPPLDAIVVVYRRRAAGS